MVKGKLIEDKNYYKLRSKQLLLFVLPSILIGLLANFSKTPNWISIVAIALYIFLVMLTIRNQKKMQGLSSKLIEIDATEIRLKSDEGSLIETIKLEHLDKIILKEEYSMPQETMKDLKEEIAGKANMHYLEIVQNGSRKRINFELNSYYMFEQLKKTIEIWKQNNFNIEYVYQRRSVYNTP